MNIDASLVRRLIDQQFPQWRRLPIQKVEPGGWDNCTFRLGSDLIVRLPSHAAYASQVAKEQRWLPQFAAQLPVAIPMPMAMGQPSDEYPWRWSVYRWIEGETAQVARIANMQAFAVDVAHFLAALQQMETVGGPSPGFHNFYRGGNLRFYHDETMQAIRTLGDRIDAAKAMAVWEAALHTTWDDLPVWVHGDISSTNLLVQNGRLSAVIDFGCLGIGDPACDLASAWTFFFGPSRKTFRDHIAADAGTWARARGWVIWKVLITKWDVSKREYARRVFNEVTAGF